MMIHTSPLNWVLYRALIQTKGRNSLRELISNLQRTPYSCNWMGGRLHFVMTSAALSWWLVPSYTEVEDDDVVSLKEHCILEFLIKGKHIGAKIQNLLLELPRSAS